MLDALWWSVPEKLAGMRKPTSTSEVTSIMPKVSAIISVLDDTENHELYEQAEMPFLWLPITGGSVPTDEQVQQARDYYKNVIAQNEGALAIHCSGGRKRTATLMASILTADMSVDEALAIIKQANPEAVPNDTQLAFLNSL